MQITNDNNILLVLDIGWLKIKKANWKAYANLIVDEW